ncbi:MAG: hypothetical protein HYZ28_21160 [Myxococcales bacterium]|nr:hypothetical protein [Myxococcales bacterium]
MATFTLRRFSSPEALKAIQEHNLIALLERHGDHFRGRGVALSPVNGSGLDYEGIVRVLMTPDEHTPKGLVDDLYFVHEMATVEAMDALREEIAAQPPKDRIRLDLGPDPTPADVAVQVRLKDPDLLERKHAEHFLTSKRSFEYFQAKKGADWTFRTPSSKAFAAIEAALDDRFDEMKRGRNSKVFVYEKEDGIWFLVRHGDPCKREGAIDDGGSSSVYYRPERYDVLKYDPHLGELCLNAENKKICALYREKFGLHFFGDARQFPGTAKYTLEPLKKLGEAALVCSDVEGMEWIRLVEIHYYWGGPEGEVEIRKASDIFSVLKRRGRAIPEMSRILRAGFLVKFTDSKTPRRATIRPNNVASYTRDGDAVVFEDFMRKRGYTQEAVEEDARVQAAVASA